MTLPSIVSYRLTPRRVVPASVWDTFLEIDRIVKDAGFPTPTSYKITLCPSHAIGRYLPYQWREIELTDPLLLPLLEDELPCRVRAEYGERNRHKEPEFRFDILWDHLLLSLVQFRFYRATLDGGQLSIGHGAELATELREYHRAKELMERLGAEECWGAPEDSVEYSGVYDLYYGADMLNFHFRRSGPQLVVAGLEEGILPTNEMAAASDASGNPHGYRREFARVVDLPWDEYWPRVERGEFLSCQMFTPEDDSREYHKEQGARVLKADALLKSWHEKNEYPVLENFWTLD